MGMSGVRGCLAGWSSCSFLGKYRAVHLYEERIQAIHLETLPRIGRASEVDTNGVKSFGFHSLCLWPTGPHWPIILLQSVLVKQLQIWTRTRDHLLGVPCLWFFLEVTSNRRESSSKSCQLRTSKNLLCCKYYLGSTFTSPLFFSLSFPLLLSLPSAGFWLHWP